MINWLKNADNRKKLSLWYHSIMRFVWPALAIPTIIWWKDAVVWVAIMSLYANMAAETATYHSTKAELETEKQSEEE